jgi:hypothetical protein
MSYWRPIGLIDWEDDCEDGPTFCSVCNDTSAGRFRLASQCRRTFLTGRKRERRISFVKNHRSRFRPVKKEEFRSIIQQFPTRNFEKSPTREAAVVDIPVEMRSFLQLPGLLACQPRNFPA